MEQSVNVLTPHPLWGPQLPKDYGKGVGGSQLCPSARQAGPFHFLQVMGSLEFQPWFLGLGPEKNQVMGK